MENRQNTDGKKVFIKKAVKFGNSAGVLLPKRLLGSEIKIIVLNKPLNIRKDVIRILENYFEELKGIYITNISKETVEILAISSSIQKIITSGKYKINIVPLDVVKKDIKINLRVRIKLNQAKTILNKSLLFDLRKDIKEYTKI